MTQTTENALKPTHAAGTPSWTDLASSAPEQSRTFYSALFGWTYELSGPEFGHYGTAQVGDRAAAGIGGTQGDMPHAWTLYFASDDVQADVARAESLGGRVLQPPFTVRNEQVTVGHMAVLADPSGAVFALWQAGVHQGAGTGDVPGGMAWQSLNTHDLPGALAFYGELLGVQVLPLGPHYFMLMKGEHPVAGVFGLGVEGGMPTPDWLKDAPSRWVTYFRVPDSVLAAERAVAGGGQVLEAPMPSPYGRLAVLTDPQGGVFGVADSTVDETAANG